MISSQDVGANRAANSVADRLGEGQGSEGEVGLPSVVIHTSRMSGLRTTFYRQGHLHVLGKRGAPQQQFRSWRQSPQFVRGNPPPRSADHRNWISTPSRPMVGCERFKILSYNILADYLAVDHQSILYFHIPSKILDWEWRKRRLFIEFGLWSPDIMCLQEVDRFYDLEGELAVRGYTGIWK
ncbi:hypothetical protein HPP92_023176 [Vanilla planifolia]|uniref:Endonuclease/exonuclease/phosphatase domain-containing protein n=1 Tax=Vanilla planifolia TaxID=51239 RepID=A0A835UCL4_VANPL|nr:hypothetical protein HPP92_023176 [Vanilla planifolia]